MGCFAGAVDGDDTTPVEDFSTAAGAEHAHRHLSRHGDRPRHRGAAVEGAVVAFGGHDPGAGDYAAVTDATGNYTITGIFAGTYPKVFARAPGGYETPSSRA